MYGWIIAGGVIGSIAVAKKLTEKKKPTILPSSVSPTKLPTALFSLTSTAEKLPATDFVVISLPSGEKWQVAREYIGPVGIGEALAIAQSRGMELPSSALVDAIWNAADLKIEPPIRHHDGTPATMSTPAVFSDQQQKITAAIAGRPFSLLAGTHKDVVMLPSGKPGLYGWNVQNPPPFTKTTGIPTHNVRGASGVKVQAGPVVQQEFGGHGLDWKDYSQGVRLVKRIG